ncbi:MAG: HAD hydrolase-like protein [Clostridia bacterium]|nr:hypothetical protein [Oscillospiraceae bacterium]MBQ7032595.1 HAD hydrolase-like protein [Clostridia bacterium]
MYRKIIFDLDGVITSESVFWDTAAVTVAEFMHQPVLSPAILREKYFYGDRLIRLVKNCGVNSNWDLVYLTLAFWETDSRGVFEAISALDMQAFDLYRAAGERLAKKTGRPPAEVKRGGPLWKEMADSFQEWFLGSTTFSEVYGLPPRGVRPGLWESEEPLVGRDSLYRTLLALKNEGISLRIGTARPLPEGVAPLRRWGVYDLFDDEGVITYNFIRRAEEQQGKTGLGKPHPYIFLKAYFGKNFPDADILAGRYEKDFSDCLVVGDAGADLFAARAMGADFAAVLTGIAGEDARPFFAENGAKYILPDITALEGIRY